MAIPGSCFLISQYTSHYVNHSFKFLHDCKVTTPVRVVTRKILNTHDLCSRSVPFSICPSVFNKKNWHCVKMKQSLIMCIVLFGGALCLGQKDSELSSLASPESNILTKRNRGDFTFTVYPSPAAGHGYGKNVADERARLFTANWPVYGVYSKADSEKIAYISVNLKRPYFVRAFAVTRYAGGTHKPTGSFFLEGSNDGNDWKMVAEGKRGQWHAPGTYPFRPSQIVKALYPGRYQYYRVIAKGWTSGWMLIFNWGLFV